jgi:hypothetical protein
MIAAHVAPAVHLPKVGHPWFDAEATLVPLGIDAFNIPHRYGSWTGVKRCRVVHETNRLRKAGVRHLTMELCCALHNFRVRLTPLQPMV